MLDVRLEVFGQDGQDLAADDDGILRTDALLHWTPGTPGVYVVRLLAREDLGGESLFMALRGTLGLGAPEPEPTERCHWEIVLAYARALDRQPRARLARAELERITGGGEFLTRLDRYWGTPLSVLQLHVELGLQPDHRSRHPEIHAAIAALEGLPDGADQRTVQILNDLMATHAKHAGDHAAAVRAWRSAHALASRVWFESHPDLRWMRLHLAVALGATGRAISRPAGTNSRRCSRPMPITHRWLRERSGPPASTWP